MVVCKISIYQKPAQRDCDEMWEMLKTRCIRDRWMHSFLNTITKKQKS